MTDLKYLGIVLLSMAVGCDFGQSVNPAMSPTGKPDLMIDTVTYTRLPTCWPGYPSGIYCFGPRFEFALKISNIGSADIAEPFCMSNSRSMADFDSQYCSYTIRVNDPPTSIPVGKSIQIAQYEKKMKARAGSK